MRARLLLVPVALAALVGGALVARRALAAKQPPPACASCKVTGKVTVRAGGKAKADASGVVVYVVGFDEKPADDALTPEMRQFKKQFVPPLLAITAGQSISFPNGDPFFHNVFSTSPTRKFDLGQYKQGDTKKKEFPSVGVVEVYCNIHPEMAATILVLPNRRFTATAADGTFTLTGVPVGTWKVFAYDRMSQKPVSGQVTVKDGGSASIDFTIDEDRTSFAHKNKFGEAYDKDYDGKSSW